MTIVAQDKLTKEQNSIVKNYIKVSKENGILIGAITSEDLWNTKPLIMKNGTLEVLRFFDGMLMDSKKHLDAFFEFSSKLRILGFSLSNNSEFIWATRPFCQSVLNQEIIFGFDSIKKRILISKLLKILKVNFEDKIVHGNICLSNIAVDNNNPYLLDYCCSAFSPSIFEHSKTLAPEIKLGNIAGFESDLYGIGRLISLLLGTDLLIQEKQLVNSLLSEDPKKRPKINEVISCFEIVEKEEKIKIQKIERDDIIINERQRHPTTKITLDPDATLESKLEWLKGTANLGKDLIDKIKEQINEDTVSFEFISKDKNIDTDNNSKILSDKINFNLPQNIGKFLIICSICFFISLITFLIIKKTRTPEVINYHELWDTGISSRMSEVAKLAINGDSQAEFLIVKDVLSGNAKPNINSELIKFAYNPTWEQTLNKNDRELILKTALSSLTLEKAEVKNVDYSPITYLALGHLAKLPEIEINKFYEIPGDFGEIFRTLSSNDVKSSNSIVFKSFVELIFERNINNNLKLYFNSNQQADLFLRLLVLKKTSIFNKEPDLILGSFLSNPINQNFSSWFKLNPTVNWNNIDSKVKLDLLTRTFPNFSFSISQLVDLIFFPLNSVALEAKSRLIGKSGIFNSEIFDVLMDHKSGLLRSQVSLLVKAFELQGEKHETVLARWFLTNPVPQTVMRLLVAANVQPGFDLFSLEAARYLSRKENKSWQASSAQLDILSGSSEELVRLLVITKLDSKIPEHYEILVKMQSKEPNEKIRKQIESKLSK